MKPENINDKETLVKYLKIFDSENLYKYLVLIDYYEKNTIHDIYKISSYIFKNIESRHIIIQNKLNYFNLSLSNNIKKLDIYQKNSNKIFENHPYWFNQDIEKNQATKEEIKEIEELLNDIQV